MDLLVPLTGALTLLAVAAYLTPSFVAFYRAVPGAVTVLVINVCAGWTGLGWFFALARALRNDPPPAAVQVISTIGGPPAWRSAVTRGLADEPGRPGQIPPPLPPRH